MIDKEIISQAETIAEDNLRQCYKDGKILASLKNFSDYWARDTFWAMGGVLQLKNFQIAKNCLNFFLSLQRADGKIPRKIALDYNGLKYLTGKSFARKKPRAIYTGNLPPFSSMDANALLIIAAQKYIEQTNDYSFASKNYAQLKSAIDWYESKFKNSFVREFGLGNWMDTIFKSGHVLYTNVVYCHALKSFAEIAKVICWEDDYILFREKYYSLKEKINEEFWNGNFFDDELGNHKNFDTAGNVLAMYFKIADDPKRKVIAEKILRLRKGKKLLPTVDPKYSKLKVNPVTYLVGMQDYQNGISWMWIDCFAAAGLLNEGHRKEAEQYINDLSEIIIKNGAVHETYFSDGKPYKARHWQSAVPFAWGSGVFLNILKSFKEIDTDLVS